MAGANPIFEGQGRHAALLAVVVGLVYTGAKALGLEGDSVRWLVFAVTTAIAHQVWVWLWWRLELHAGWASRTFGPAGFQIYGAGFALLALSRLGALVALASADRGSLAKHATALALVGAALIAPVLYLFYSVARYFTFRRALGADHFDPAYRKKPLETRGIFRYTRNGMYIYGLMIVWLPGLFAASSAALLAAAFNHAYLWVHYYCTERPDMMRIYGST